jgi:hypothetical protein
MKNLEKYYWNDFWSTDLHYCLDLECPLGPIWEKLSSQDMKVLKGGRNFNQPSVGSSGHWWCAHKENNWTQPLPLSLFFMAWPWSEQFFSASCYCHDALPHFRHINNRFNQTWTETSKPLSQNKSLFLYNLIISGIFL